MEAFTGMFGKPRSLKVVVLSDLVLYKITRAQRPFVILTRDRGGFSPSSVL